MKVKSESKVAQSCSTPSDPMDCSLPGSSTHGIFQAGVLEWGAIPFSYMYIYGSSLVAQAVKNLPAMQETWVQSLDWKDPLEKGIATHSNILAWEIPWTEEPCGLQSMGSQRAGYYRATNTHIVCIYL